MITQDELKKLAKIFKALSNENRLQLFTEILRNDKLAINESGCFISEIASRLKIGAPTVSHHVKELENAELITTNKQGKLITAHLKRETSELIVKLVKV